MTPLRETIAAWVGRLSEPRQEFGGMAPCPFAQSATVTTRECADLGEARRVLLGICGLAARAVVVIGLPEGVPEGAAVLIDETAAELEKRDLVALVSDATLPLTVSGVQTTQTDRLLILVQSRAELAQARKALKRTGYYDRWSVSALAKVWR